MATLLLRFLESFTIKKKKEVTANAANWEISTYDGADAEWFNHPDKTNISPIVYVTLLVTIRGIKCVAVASR